MTVHYVFDIGDTAMWTLLSVAVVYLLAGVVWGK
jgi:flagellar biosynthesis protein FliQ